MTPKKKQKTAAASSEENTETDVEENENTVPKTPKSAKKGGRGALARALPDGFKVEVKKTEKKEWKEYRGPDGKRYTSIAEIYRKLGLEEDSGAGAGTSSPAPSGSGGSPYRRVRGQRAGLLYLPGEPREVLHVGLPGIHGVVA